MSSVPYIHIHAYSTLRFAFNLNSIYGESNIGIYNIEVCICLRNLSKYLRFVIECYLNEILLVHYNADTVVLGDAECTRQLMKVIPY